MLLSEVLDKPYKYSLSKNELRWSGSFITDEKEKYHWEATDESAENVWHIMFINKTAPKIAMADRTYDDPMPGTQVTNSGNEFRVFATVMDMTKKFVRTVEPDRINFSAKEKSRTKLYKTLIRKFATTLGYSLEHMDDDPGGVTFYLKRK